MNNRNGNDGSKVRNNDWKLIFRTLKYRNYRLFFTGQSISLIGTWIQMIALNWLVYRLTGSAFMLGLVGFVSRFPAFFLAPFAGVIADRMNRYHLLILTQVLLMVQSAILAVLLFANVVQIWHLIALGLFAGIINSFDMPVRQSFVIEMIEKKEDLGNAIALNSVLVNIARLAGPTIAGILIALIGEGWCFFINTISFIAIIWSLMAMRITTPKHAPVKTNPITELKEGFSYTFGFPPIRTTLMVLALVSLMGMPYQVLMPVFAVNVFKGGAHSLGFLMGAAGFGALFGGLFLASRKTVLGTGRNISIAASLFGIGLILFSITRVFWLALPFLMVAGFGMMVNMASCNTLLQTLSDDDKRGRVMSFYAMAFMGMVPFGNLLSGTLAKVIGVPNTVLFGGICCILGGLYYAYKLPSLRKLSREIYIKKQIIPADVRY
jgi:MFS family permease